MRCGVGPRLVVVVLSLFPSLARAQDWKDSIKAQLTNWVTPASASSDRLRITKPGTVLIVERDGISASPGKDASYLKTICERVKLRLGLMLVGPWGPEPYAAG